MGISGGPYIVRDSSLAFDLDAADRNSYPGGGNTWTDLTGNNNSGSLINGPLFNEINGGSIAFDGIDDYALTPTNTAFGTNPFSIDMWFKPSGSQSTNSTLMCIAAAAAAGNWQISFTSNALVFQGSTSILGTSTYTASDSWANFTVVRESTSANQTKFYINGIPDTSFTVTNNFTDATGYRRGMNRGSAVWFKGSIANARVYNRALSASEVQQNYEAQASRFRLNTDSILTTTSTTTTTTTAAPTTTTTTSTTTTTTTQVYTVTVYQGNSAARTVGGISGIYYKLGSGGSKTTLATGITDPTCPTTTLRGTITNVPAGTVLYIGAQIGGTTDQTFGAQTGTSCPASSTTYCGYTTNPYTVTVNSNISVTLNLNVSAGAYTTC